MGTLQIWGEMLVTSRSNLVISNKKSQNRKRYASMLIGGYLNREGIALSLRWSVRHSVRYSKQNKQRNRQTHTDPIKAV